jgi:6-phosphofructokinase 1
VTLRDLAADVERMVDSFAAGQRLFLTVRNERADAMYDSDFLRRVFEQEGRGIFDARQIVLGQTQQGGSPSPFDRILATRLAAHAITWLSDEIGSGGTASAVIGLHDDGVRIVPLQRAEELADLAHRRPADQWWLRLRPTVDMLAARLRTGA